MARRVRLALVLAAPFVGGCAIVAMGGCAKPLFSPEEYRSQFDRFDAARGKYAEQYAYDAYGRRRPNIEGRLAPRE